MSFSIKCFTALVITLCLISPTQAATPSHQDILAQLRQHSQKAEFQQAYALAQQYLFELEGNTEFDFYYGLSAMQTGHFNDALFNFERLSTSYPQVQRYRLELARCYFFLGNLDRAEIEFKRVLTKQPPVAVAANIEHFLATIQQQRKQKHSQWYGSISLAGGYDSNINSATTAESFAIPLVNNLFLVLPNDQKNRQQGSAFAQTRAILGVSKPLSLVSSVGAAAVINQKMNTRIADFDLTSLGLQIDYRHLMGNLQLRPSIAINHYLLAERSLQQDISLNNDIYWSLHSNYQPFMRFGITNSDNKANQDLDSTQYQGELGLGLNFGRFSSQISALYAKDQAKGQVKAYMQNTTGINLSAQYRYYQHELYSQLALRLKTYQAPMVAFNQTRDETFNQWLAGYRYRANKQISVYLQSSYINNRSNINLYQYKRSLSEAGLTFAF